METRPQIVMAGLGCGLIQKKRWMMEPIPNLETSAHQSGACSKTRPQMWSQAAWRPRTTTQLQLLASANNGESEEDGSFWRAAPECLD